MKLKAMKNIGAEMERKLAAVGVSSAEALIQIGSKEAFLRLKAAYPQVCSVHLYALQGAIDDLDFHLLPPDIKEKLRAFGDSLT